jgi:hypothetical protein
VINGTKQLYAVTNSHVYKLALERCSRHRKREYVTPGNW